MRWSPPPDSIKPHPENVDGPFYVEDGCCLTCGIPEHEAPEIFGWTEKAELSQCVVKRQPVTPDEVTQTLFAIANGELDCIRYRGDDPSISRRLVEIGEGAQCDLPPPADARPVSLSFVTFTGEASAPSELATRFENWLREQDRVSPYEVEPARRTWSGDYQVRFAWYGRNFHSVTFKAGQSSNDFAAVTPVMRPYSGAARILDTWLRSESQFATIRWFSDQDHRTEGRETLV